MVIRLGLLTGIGLALFKVLQGRRSASEFGSPSADWAPPSTPSPNLPKAPPEPALVEPVMFEEIIEKKAAIRAVPEPVSQPDAMPAAEPAPAAAGPVKKVAPKKAAAKKTAPPAAPEKAPTAKKAAPAKKAPKKTQ